MNGEKMTTKKDWTPIKRVKTTPGKRVPARTDTLPCAASPERNRNAGLIPVEHLPPELRKFARIRQKNARTCRVVGIGASAGGLEAIIQVLKDLPEHTGMAFVFVQHLDPTHKSKLAEILTEATALPVHEIQSNTPVEPNHLYVMPPNTNLVIFHGTLHLLPRPEISQQHLPIDYFLHSLAEDQGCQAIGVILSGNASDGTAGLKAIKAAGGTTFAQSPESAKYDGMPRHAIAAGCVDYVLPPCEIAGKLTRLGPEPGLSAGKAHVTAELLLNDHDNLNRIFSLLRAATGADFTFYKSTIVKRRIMSRMAINNIDELPIYVRYLQHNAVELQALSQGILIGVTNFFREPEMFQQLKADIFPKLMKDRLENAPVRIWVPGCSTGEETYSIAITLVEFLEEQGINQSIQIFTTDLNGSAIEKARSGIYPESIKRDMTPERLSRFFLKVKNGYQIRKKIRDLCIFAVQNIIKDPPFSGLDLISCRNVLIYLGPVLQYKIIPTFHYALKPTGYLILGASESVGNFLDLFATVDKKNKIYVKKGIITPLKFDFAPFQEAAVVPEDVKAMNNGRTDLGSDYDMLQEADRILLGKYAPASIVINNKLEILQFRGQTDFYLTHPPGLASMNLLKMARLGLSIELDKAIHQADKAGSPVRKEGLQIHVNGQHKEVNLEVTPLKGPSPVDQGFLIVFEEVFSRTALKAVSWETAKEGVVSGKESGKPGSDAEKSEPENGSEEIRQLMQLKQELAATVEYQQSIIQQRETAYEELHAANEEIQASNEELQSTYEEMETAKEELQATNEELTTVNDELRNRNAELSLVNNDLNNFLSSIDIPIVILGNDLCIRRFTAMAEKLFNLIPADLGRPLSDLKPNLNLPDLEAMILEVIARSALKEVEVQDRWGRWYSMCIRPYKTYESNIDGVVLTLFDINALKPSLEQLQESRDYAAIIETIREPFLILDAAFRVKLANQSFCRTFQVAPSETQNRLIFDLGDGQWNIPMLRALLEEILPKNSSFHDFKVEHHFPTIGHKVMLLNARRVVGEGRLTPFILLAFEDMTG